MRPRLELTPTEREERKAAKREYMKEWMRRRRQGLPTKGIAKGEYLGPADTAGKGWRKRGLGRNPTARDADHSAIPAVASGRAKKAKCPDGHAYLTTDPTMACPAKGCDLHLSPSA